MREAGVDVFYAQRLDRRLGVAKEGTTIVAITMESGRTFRGRIFLDATYEGDLMAAAGVAYAVGREAAGHYGETLDGVQVKQAVHHQLLPGVDPYVVKGDPRSGLLPFIEAGGPGGEGDGDRRVQAYCFRMCLTDCPENRIPFSKPQGYNELWYELLLRNLEAGQRQIPWINSPMPNRKTDINNNTGVSTDFIGQNYDYAEASYADRAEIVARHRQYQQGLMWTLANHPRVPESMRKEVARWGTCKDEFVERQGWQEQIYVREARRMIGPYVMTQHDCQGQAVAADAVGLAAYTMDSHHVQRYVDARGHQVRNEGDVQVGGFPPYPDQLPCADAEGRRVRQPAGARLPIGLAHCFWLDPHGTGLHGPGPVGGDGRLPGHRRGLNGPIRRLRTAPSAIIGRQASAQVGPFCRKGLLCADLSGNTAVFPWIAAH